MKAIPPKLIVLQLLRAGGDAGVTGMELLALARGVGLAHETMYTTLHRLEHAGLVTRTEAVPGVRGGRPRRFALSFAGRVAANAEHDVLVRLVGVRSRA